MPHVIRERESADRGYEVQECGISHEDTDEDASCGG
jgi:hypothetical protein